MLTQLASMVGGMAEINLMAWMYALPLQGVIYVVSSLLLVLAYDTVRANAAGKAAMGSVI